MSISVAVVEDNASICRSIERVLALSKDCRWVGTSRNGRSALQAIPGQRPDVVIMDIELPDLSGIECTARLKRLLPEVRILIFTVYKDHEQIFKALKAGANGYVLKRSSVDEIVGAVRDVKEGGAPMSAEIASQVVRSFHKPLPSGTVPESLTRREAEILDLLAQGHISKHIADKLGISYDTVRGHLGHIYDKLHVRSRTEAVIRYLGKNPDARG